MVEPTYHTLDNGLRIVHLHLKGCAVGHCGFVVNAGSRDEDLVAGEGGLAHFVEHTIFKGTSRRRASHILNRTELVGGELNAYTSKEETLSTRCFQRGICREPWNLLPTLCKTLCFPSMSWKRRGRWCWKRFCHTATRRRRPSTTTLRT